MKKLLCIIVLIFVASLATISCVQKSNSSDNNKYAESTIVNDDDSNDIKSKVTKEMAYDGINNYCHQNFDWSIAKENPDIMSVEMGEEIDTEYQVIFRSYTGSLTYFYVNKSDGKTRIVEYVPALDIREESGTINIFDYLE